MSLCGIILAMFLVMLRKEVRADCDAFTQESLAVKLFLSFYMRNVSHRYRWILLLKHPSIKIS